MTEAELARQIRLGEDSALELKSVNVDRGRVKAPDKRDLADELSAFANSRGGTVLLGVEDDTRRIIRFDESPVPNTTREDLNYALTQRFLRGDATEPASLRETQEATAATAVWLRST